MHEAARGLDNNLPQRVDGLIDSHCSEEEFLRQLTGLCAGARDSAWTVLARIDQNYRRGKLSPERFRIARLSIERRMLGFNDARAASLASRPRETEAPSPPPAIEALAVVEPRQSVQPAPVAASTVRFAPAPESAPPASDTGSLADSSADTPHRWRALVILVILAIIAALAAALVLQMYRAGQTARTPVTVTTTDAPSNAVAEPVRAATPPPAARVGFDRDRAVVQPGQATAEVSVVRTGDTSTEVRIPWWTESAGARAGQDFVARARHTLVLAPGEEHGSVQVPILRNPQRRHIQLFYVRMGKPDGAELDAAARVPVFIVPR